MNEEIFTTGELPVSGNYEVKEGKGKHIFSAIGKAKGDAGLLSKYLIVELVKVNGERLTEDSVDELNMRDVCHLYEVINLMLSNDFSSKF